MIEGHLHVFLGPTTDIGKIESGICTFERRTIPPKDIQRPKTTDNFEYRSWKTQAYAAAIS